MLPKKHSFDNGHSAISPLPKSTHGGQAPVTLTNLLVRPVEREVTIYLATDLFRALVQNPLPDPPSGLAKIKFSLTSSTTNPHNMSLQSPYYTPLESSQRRPVQIRVVYNEDQSKKRVEKDGSNYAIHMEDPVFRSAYNILSKGVYSTVKCKGTVTKATSNLFDKTVPTLKFNEIVQWSVELPRRHPQQS